MICETCGNPFTRPTGQNRVNGRLWAKRRFCSLACCWASRRKPRPPAVCAACGTAFPARHGQRNRFCGRACYRAARDPVRRVAQFLEERG